MNFYFKNFKFFFVNFLFDTDLSLLMNKDNWKNNIKYYFELKFDKYVFFLTWRAEIEGLKNNSKAEIAQLAQSNIQSAR